MNVLSTVDQTLLTWFFGAGQAAFERSTMGGMLTHAELFSSSGAIEWFRDQVMVGRQLLWEYKTRVSFETLSRTPSEWPHVEHGEIIYPEDEITAFPTAEHDSSNPGTPLRWLIQRYDKASSRLHEMLKRAETVELEVVGSRDKHVLTAVQAFTTLENYCGDLGAQWSLHRDSRIAKVGRIGSLYHMTPAGRRLLELAAADRGKAGQPVSEATTTEQMQNEVAATANTNVKAELRERRRVGLIRTDRQSNELLRGAGLLWNAARDA